jgi:hypothetical protein
MMAGKKAKNKRKEMAAARVVMLPFVTDSMKKRPTKSNDKPSTPGHTTPFNRRSSAFLKRRLYRSFFSDCILKRL